MKLWQSLLHSVQGKDRLWYCGSYFGYGFLEDALHSALAMCTELGVRPHWEHPATISGPATPILEVAT